MTKRFVSLVAVSSERQAEGISLEDQSLSIKREIDRWGGDWVERLEIPGHTRVYTSLQEAEIDIPAYNRLHELIVGRRFDVLIFFNYSRLARDIGVGGNIVSLCQKYKIILYQSSSPPASLEFRRDAMAMYMASLGLAASHNEVDEIKRRHEMGMKERIKSGNFAKLPPWGWRYHWVAADGGKPSLSVEIDEKAKNTIVKILDLYLSGQGCAAIAAAMNSDGATTPTGKQWTHSTINKVVRGVWQYAGVLTLNKRSKDRELIQAQSKWPAVIDRDLALKVEKEHKSRMRRSVHSPHRFSQVVYCVACQSKMNATTVTRKNGNVLSIYECRRKRHPKGIKMSIHEQAIDVALRKILSSNQEYINAIAGLPMDDGRKNSTLEAITSTEKEIIKLADGVSRANTLYAIEQVIDRGEYDRLVASISAKRKAAQDRLLDLTRALTAIEHDEKRADRVNEFAEIGLALLDNPNIIAANAALKRIVRVWAENAKVVEVEIL